METKKWAVTIRNNRIFLTDPDSEKPNSEEIITASSVQDILDFAKTNHIKLRSFKIQTTQFSSILNAMYWIGEYEKNQLTIKRTKSNELIINIQF